MAQVETPHADYTKFYSVWQKMRSVQRGRDAIIAACLSRFAANNGDNFVQKLSDQALDEYERYIRRGCWFGATSRTIDAMQGMINAKEYDLQAPQLVLDYAQNIDLAGTTYEQMIADVTFEECLVTRIGMLVDYPSADTSGMTQAEAEALNLRPYIRTYKAESIINWWHQNIGGVDVLAHVVLCEQVNDYSDYSVTVSKQYRVLDLVDGIYRQRLVSDADIVLDETFPVINGQPITEIPFYVVGGLEVRKPLLNDLADINLAHFANSVDYEFGLHRTAIPQPWVAGVSIDETLKVGAETAWTFNDPSAKAEYLEFSGSGLQQIAASMLTKQQQMAVLGARMLVDEKATAEATNTVSIRTAGERTSLTATARDIAECFEKALRMLTAWAGQNPDEVQFTINVDFGNQNPDAALLGQIMAAVQSGNAPSQVLHEYLMSTGLTKLNYTDFIDMLDAQTPQADFGAAPTTLMDTVQQRLGLNNA